MIKWICKFDGNYAVSSRSTPQHVSIGREMQHSSTLLGCLQVTDFFCRYETVHTVKQDATDRRGVIWTDRPTTDQLTD